MSNLSKEQENYIEHEVRLRVHDAIFNHIDYKFNKLEDKIEGVNTKFNWTIALIISSIIIPVVLHRFGLI